jgi:mitochondrial fission 1 protein
VHNTEKRHIRDGVRAADQLISLGVDEHRQLGYLAAVGEYKLGKAVEARQRLKTLLEHHPEFGQAKTLLEAVDDKLTTDTLVAGGTLAAAGAIAGLVVAALVSGGRR